MLRKTETDRTANIIESISPEHQQISESVEQWKRASRNSPVMIQLKKVINLMGHIVYGYAKNAEKQIQQLKRF